MIKLVGKRLHLSHFSHDAGDGEGEITLPPISLELEEGYVCPVCSSVVYGILRLENSIQKEYSGRDADQSLHWRQAEGCEFKLSNNYSDLPLTMADGKQYLLFFSQRHFADFTFRTDAGCPVTKAFLVETTKPLKQVLSCVLPEYYPSTQKQHLDYLANHPELQEEIWQEFITPMTMPAQQDLLGRERYLFLLDKTRWSDYYRQKLDSAIFQKVNEKMSEIETKEEGK
jgi:hypothetical protein